MTTRPGLPSFALNDPIFSFLIDRIRIFSEGGSPGLVVMGRDSRSEGRGFESRHRILDGHFFTYICCKILKMFV